VSGRGLQIFVRPGNGTKVSGPLQAAIDAGFIEIIRGSGS